MLAPLAVLALLSLGGGYLDVPKFLEPVFAASEEPHELTLVMISVAAGAAGIGLAFLMYVARPGLADAVAGRLGVLYRLVYHKYFVDEIYDAAVVRPVVSGSRVLLWRFFDAAVIDGIVNGIGARARDIGGVLRLAQSGNIRSYAAWVLLGAVLLLVVMGLAGDAR